MIDELLRKLHAWLIRRCQHDGGYATYDVLEGAYSQGVTWCKQCGAYRIVKHNYSGPSTFLSEWRIPRPEWKE